MVDDGTTSDDDRLGAIGDIGFVIEREGIDDGLVVVAGDNLFSEPLGDFGRVARERGAPLLATHDVGDLELVRGRYNSIEVDAHGRITYFEEKSEEPRSHALRHRPLLLSARHPAAHPRSTSRAGTTRTSRAGLSSGSTRASTFTPGTCPASGTTSVTAPSSRKPTAVFSQS